MEKNVFISWSGDRSRIVAEGLRDWIPQVIQIANPWMPKEDINKGTRWLIELSNQLEKTNIGIFCITRENLTAPWLLFEAGAVGKALKESRVCTYLIGLTPTDIGEPLSQFQATLANRTDTRKLLFNINQAFGEYALKEFVLDKVFEKFWPDFEQVLKTIPPEKEEHKPVREPQELLEEILSIVRELGRIDLARALGEVRATSAALPGPVSNALWEALVKAEKKEANNLQPTPPHPKTEKPG